MIDQQYKWYPVYTNSRAEKKAYDELIRKGITAYLPLKRQSNNGATERKW